MKRMLVMMMIASMAVCSMTGCGGSGTTAATTEAASTEAAATEKQTETAAETEAQTTEAAETETEEVTTAAAEESTTEAKAEETTAYTLTGLKLRSKADADAGTLDVIPVGETVTAISLEGEWCLVCYDGQEGYVYAKYLTADQEQATAAKKEAEAKAKAEAESKAKAEADAKKESENSKPAETTAKPTEAPAVKEVSREKFDDCDGSGHGYYLITYSDGSTSTEEY